MAEQRAINNLQYIRETKLGTYANEPPLVSKDFKLEAADSADYGRRFVFELLQNADDEMPEDSDKTRKVRFELRGDCLLVANTGRSFDAADLDAITTLTQTTKVTKVMKPLSGTRGGLYVDSGSHIEPGDFFAEWWQAACCRVRPGKDT
ncbi:MULTISPECIES: hypothetical protein [unclassified Natrinema]|uniref:hypothetical protein n=1 Tax=unclassified Natrinema TaxID=2622230 RepID=UPI00026D5315|nr:MULTISPECIES: hypothetical protein [unclassified Natrinema]AFO57503.1 hypothetical protein NJ7G_2265 [Natrinema sp. J7-2]